MKKILLSFLLIVGCLMHSWAASNEASINLSGTWKGTRYQYNYEKSKYVAEFSYVFELVQNGNLVSGTTTITSESGKYAKMELQGFIEGDKLHFEEKSIIDATRSENMAWCLKKGTLDIAKEDNVLVLSGKTASFMEIYGLECTGGYTYITREQVSQPTDDAISDRIINDPIEASYQINTYPNPFILNTTISFVITEESKVSVDIADMQGRVTNILAETVLKPNSYKLDFTPKDAVTNTYYIVNIRINDKVYTRHIQKFEGLGGASSIK